MSPPSARSGSGSGPRTRFVLASASPRRREILTRLGVEFDVVVPDVEEASEGAPELAVVENARRKAGAGAELAGAGPALVLGVDTDVALDGRLLGKPTGPDAARERLEALSGRTHEVLSGVAVVATDGDDASERTAVARTEVTFRRLEPQIVDLYVRSGEWEDRAGGYAIQGLGSLLVARIEGDFSNVVGLPVTALLELVPELLG